jgi:hypothetical protein
MFTVLAKAFDDLARATYSVKKGSDSLFDAKKNEERRAIALMELDDRMSAYFRPLPTMSNQEKHDFVLHALHHANQHFENSSFSGRKNPDYGQPAVMLPFYDKLVEITAFHILHGEDPLAAWKSLDGQCRLSRDEVRRVAAR